MALSGNRIRRIVKEEVSGSLLEQRKGGFLISEADLGFENFMKDRGLDPEDLKPADLEFMMKQYRGYRARMEREESEAGHSSPSRGEDSTKEAEVFNYSGEKWRVQVGDKVSSGGWTYTVTRAGMDNGKPYVSGQTSDDGPEEVLLSTRDDPQSKKITLSKRPSMDISGQQAARAYRQAQADREKREMRGLMQEVLALEGWFDDTFGRVRGMFGGGEKGSGRESRPLMLSDLIPMSPAIADAGFTRKDIDHLQGGGFGGSLKTRTYPAAFMFGLTPMSDGVQWSHPFLVRGAIIDQPALERYIVPVGRMTPDLTPRLKIPEESRYSSDRQLGSTAKFPKGVPSDADLKRMGVNMTQWNEYTRDLGPEKRDRRAKELARAAVIVKELEAAFRVLDDVYRNRRSLFKPTGD